MIEVAELKGALVEMREGVADGFGNLFGVSAGGGPLTVKHKLMTASNAPAGYIASASSVYSSYPAWKAFDGDGSTRWEANASTGWLQIEFPTRRLIEGYAIDHSGWDTSYAPRDWIVEGSNDGSSWTALDAQSGHTDWGSARYKIFTINTPSSYTRYRITVSANNGASRFLIDEWQLLEQGFAFSLIDDHIVRTPLGYETDFPAMTGNSQGGHILSASSQYGPDTSGYAKYNAFNRSLDPSGWYSGNGQPTGWLQRQLPQAETLYSYGVQCSNESQSANSWILQGSNDGVSFDDLDTQTGVAAADWGPNPGQLKDYVLATPAGPYLYYRLQITANNGGSYVKVGELVLRNVKIGNDDMSAVSINFAAGQQPDIAMLTARIIPDPGAAAPTFGADIILSASRDGGGSWSDATVTTRTMSDGTIIAEDTAIDLSSQPPGTDMRWRAQVIGRDDALDAIVLQWRP